MSITAWSTTANVNGNRLVSGNYLEQQSPSTLNDAGRSVMAQVRSWANDLEWFEYGTGSNTVTYTRVSATSVSMPTDCVNQFHVNRRVKIIDGTNATVYGRITSSTYSSPNTTLTFEFDSGSLGSGNPTSVAYGIVSANNTSLPSVVPTGTVLMTGGASADSGYLFCDGTAYSRTTYSALFTKVSTTYGVGDGSSTFNVPDLQAKFPLGKSGSHALGTTGGAFAQTPTGSISSSFTGNPFTPLGNISVSGTVAGHQLSVSEMPSHNHSMTLYLGGYGTVDTSTGNGYRIAGGDYNTSIPGFSGTNYSGNNTGSNSTHAHGFSGSGTFNGTSSNPSGSVASTLTGSALDTTNPYVALNYQIKY